LCRYSEVAAAEAEYLAQVEFTLAELTEGGGDDDMLTLEEISLELVEAKLMAPTVGGCTSLCQLTHIA
jgi:hypothetical protein